MNVANLTLLVGVLLFLRIFFLSFMHDEKIFIYFYQLNPLGFIAIFYIFLAFMLYAMSKQIRLEFIVMQLLFSLSLLGIGEYTYCLFLQFLFLFLFFNHEKNFFLILYLLALHKSLLLLFSFSPLLYFANLALLLYTLVLKTDYFQKLEEINLWIILGSFLSIFALYMQIENFIFDFYIWLDVEDVQNYQVSFVVYGLSLLHLFIFMILRRVIQFKLD